MNSTDSTLTPGRFAAKQLSLTYPQCPLSKEAAASLLSGALASHGIQQLVICQEKHEDGSPHLHAYVSLDKKYQCRGKHELLTLDGHYPNVQVTKCK